MVTPGVTVHLIGEAVEESVYSVGLAEEVDVGDETFALIFSISEPDEDGDGYSVVAEPGQRTAYNAVERCALNGTHLHLRFTAAAAAGLDLPREFVLDLDVSGEEVQLLERGLERVGVASSRCS